jgi:hypothetical protein
MSANLDLVRSISADWERGDFRRVGACPLAAARDFQRPECAKIHYGAPQPQALVCPMGSASTTAPVGTAENTRKPVESGILRP